jgi:hypothetical protein
MLGPHFDTSLSEGQIALPAGAACRVGTLGSIGARHVGALEALAGDRDAALSALFERLVESSYLGVSQRAVLAAEREVIRASFHGSRSAYVGALRAAQVNVALARSVLADELRQARLEQRLPAPSPPRAEASDFYSSYPQLLVRRVRVSPSAPWAGGTGRDGLAVEGAAPQRVFSLPTGRRARVTTLLGTYTVRPLAGALELGALSFTAARPAIVAALKGFERTQAFGHWTIARQRAALATAICRRDELPQPTALDLTQYLPFLRIR